MWACSVARGYVVLVRTRVVLGDAARDAQLLRLLETTRKVLRVPLVSYPAAVCKLMYTQAAEGGGGVFANNNNNPKARQNLGQRWGLLRPRSTSARDHPNALDSIRVRVLKKTTGLPWIDVTNTRSGLRRTEDIDRKTCYMGRPSPCGTGELWRCRL